MTTYYIKLHKIFDELMDVELSINCICLARYIINSRKESDQLIMFLNGLNDNYDGIRNQVLLMDPLPSMSKSYSAILQIEKQKQVSIVMELGALTLEGKSQRRGMLQTKELGFAPITRKRGIQMTHVLNYMEYQIRSNR